MNEARPNGRAGFSRAESSRGGFTLVELLMVILIIGLLMALLLPAVQRVRLEGIRTAQKVDIDNISKSLEEFKAKYGGYPPGNYWHRDEIATFIRRAWPRFQATNSQWNTLLNTLRGLSPAETLVFWLGGFPDANGNRMNGFSADPRNPFNRTASQRIPPMFAFSETHLADRDGDGFPEYYAPQTKPGEDAPYVYFAARPNRTYWIPGNTAGSNRGTGNNDLPAYQHPNAQGWAVPYLFTRNGSTPAGFTKSDSFQIFIAAFDNDYGARQRKLYPAGVNYGPGDEDNLTNFSPRTLDEARQ